MRDVSVTELKNKLSEYLRLVKQGEIIQVLERSTPIALIQAVRLDPREDDSLINRLIREGVVTPARRRSGKDIVDKPLIPCDGNAVQAVIDGRGDR
jgi:prevent-host-death family protein